MDHPLAEGSLDEIRSFVRAWLREHLPDEWLQALVAEDAASVTDLRRGLDPHRWWKLVAEAGLAAPSWPTQYGGLGLSATQAAVVREELGAHATPHAFNPVGLNLVASTLLAHGTEDQRRRYLPRIASHEELWCQLFSEPGAGSDLASLATRAVARDGAWVINGQKVWTSRAEVARFGLLLARTDVDAPKHRGITAFIVDMQDRGVTVRPLRQITGDAEFNEVFLDDVVVGNDMVVGDVNDGWRVTRTVLSHERRHDSGGRGAVPGTVPGRSVDSLIEHHRPITDPRDRQCVAQAWIERAVIDWTIQRAAAKQRRGDRPGPEGSITKLFQSESLQHLQKLVLDLDGPGGVAWMPGDRWAERSAWAFLRVKGRTIAGGTSEVMRNILGERILGLPREPSADHDIAWKDVPRSGIARSESARSDR